MRFAELMMPSLLKHSEGDIRTGFKWFAAPNLGLWGPQYTVYCF